MAAIALWVILWVIFHAAIVAAVFGNQAFPAAPHPHPPADRHPLLGAAPPPPRFLPTKPKPIQKPKPDDDDVADDDDTWEYLSRTV